MQKTLMTLIYKFIFVTLGDFIAPKLINLPRYS